MVTGSPPCVASLSTLTPLCPLFNSLDWKIDEEQSILNLMKILRGKMKVKQNSFFSKSLCLLPSENVITYF